MKRLAAVLLLGLVALSCSKGSATEEVEYKKELSFSGYTARSVTKASGTEPGTKANGSFVSGSALPSGTAFGVYAYNTGSATFTAGNTYPVFMGNVPVTYDGVSSTAPSSYSYSPLRYWPNEEDSNKLTFFAYYPHNGAGFTPAGFGSFVFTVQDSPENQVDLMLSDVVANKTYHNTNSSAGVINLSFYHMLTQVRFKGITNLPAGATVKVTSLQITNIINKATITPAVSATESTITPTTSSKASYTITSGEVTLPSSTVPNAEAADLAVYTSGVANKTLLMIPQTIPADAKLIVSYTITTTVPARTFSDTQQIDFNTAIAAWSRNQQIVYTLTIGNAIEFSASVDDWGVSDIPIRY